MFGTMVVGVDGREGGRDALALAWTLARGGGAELVAVHAYPYDARPLHASVVDLRASLRDEAKALLDRELAETAVSARKLVVGDTSPARALHAAAEQEGAGLVVVGSTHHGAVGRVLVGDVATGTLHHAPCPVAVAPRAYAGSSGQLGTIGVGFDGGEESREAVRVAVELARKFAARLEILSVILAPIPSAFPTAYDREWAEEAERHRREAAEVVRRLVDEAGVLASGGTIVGRPREELLALSRRVDLLVVGSRGWGPVRRLLLGSTSNRLMRESACPVLVVPRPKATGQPGESDAAALGSAGDRMR